MPKTWNPGDAKRFAREVKLNKPYYIVYTHALNLGPYEDSQTYGEIRFTTRSPVTGNVMTADGQSARGICERAGGIHEQPPRGLRNIADPAPQVAGPLPQGYEAYLDEEEVRQMEKEAANGSNPRTRRPLGSWRV